MKQPYQILIDVWEGNPDFDPAVLKANGVTGCIVRLNDMRGGHHVDERFAETWAKAQEFDAQALYFVYNPWVSGRANFDWLINHLPLDYGTRRIFADVEVRYAGYAPKTYGAELAAFLALVRAAHPVTVYSGGGFLDILTPWPTDVDYWWAGYSVSLTACTTWAEYYAALGKVDYASYTKLSPSTARMWQATGDGVRLEGFGTHAVDVNVFPGTLEDLAAWFGCPIKGETMDWTQNAIGLYTAKAGWTNNAFDFIVGFAGGNWTQQSPGVIVLEPNPNLKPIETQARAEGKVFLALWDFDVDYYRRQQYMATEDKWPSLEMDYPYQRLVAALANRDIDGLIIRVLNRKNLDGGNEMMTYVSFAARKFIERANKWLYTTKGLNKWTFVLTNDGFLRTEGQQESFYAWAKNWYLGVEQAAVLPLASGAWPQPTDKIAAVPPSLGWKLWHHYKTSALNMMVWNGTDEDMRDFLQIGTPPPPPPPPGDDDHAEILARLNSLEVENAALTGQIAAFEVWKERITNWLGGAPLA